MVALNSWSKSILLRMRETQHKSPPSGHPNSHSALPLLLDSVSLTPSPPPPAAHSSVISTSAENHDDSLSPLIPGAVVLHHVITKNLSSSIQHEIQDEKESNPQLRFQIRALKALTFHLKSQ